MNMPLKINHGQDINILRRRTKEILWAEFPLQRLAVETGVKRAALLDWIEERNNESDIQNSIAQWFREGDEEAAKQTEPEWVPTHTSMAIMDALNYAQITPTISLIYGGAGVSKSTTAKHYAKEYGYKPSYGDGAFGRGGPNVFYIEAATWIRTQSAMFEEILAAMGNQAIPIRYPQDNGKTILRLLVPGDLLIIDEAQHLDADALDGIRHFHDAAGIGIAYLGNEKVYTRINGRANQATFAQLSSRVGMRKRIELPAPDDVDAVMEAWGISGRQERTLAHSIALRPGGLRNLSQTLRLARTLAAGMRKPVNVGIMKSAASRLDPNFRE